MKPSERFQACVIGAVVILLTSLAFLPSSLLRWAGDPGDLRFFGWFALTVLCGAAIGVIRGLRNKWLLFLAVPPAAVLAYEGWYILKRIVVGLVRDPATLWTTLLLIWIFVTWWLWEERRQYKEDSKFWRETRFQQQPSHCPHCGAHL